LDLKIGSQTMSLFSNHAVFLFFLGEKQSRIAQLIATHGGTLVNVLTSSVTLVVTLETKLPFGGSSSNNAISNNTSASSVAPPSLLYQLRRAESIGIPVVVDAWIEAAVAEGMWLPFGDFLCVLPMAKVCELLIIVLCFILCLKCTSLFNSNRNQSSARRWNFAAFLMATRLAALQYAASPMRSPFTASRVRRWTLLCRRCRYSSGTCLLFIWLFVCLVVS
jgi:hypothetical protein